MGGLLLVLAFPSHDQWWWAPIGVAVLALAVRGRGIARGAAFGFVFGLGFFVPLLHWSGIYVGALPWLALATLEALYLAVLGALLAPAWRAPGGAGPRALAMAGLWVGQEALRDRTPFGGFPWGRLAFSQVDGPAVWWASVGGAPLVTFVIALVGAGIAVSLAQVLDRVPEGLGSHLHLDWRAVTRDLPGTARSAGRGLRVASRCLHPVALRDRVVAAPRTAGLLVWPVAATVLVLVSGVAVPRSQATPPLVTVSAVQGNVEHPGLHTESARREVLASHAEATGVLADEAALGTEAWPDLVIWPEDSSDIDPLRDAKAAATIQKAADAVNAPVVVGAVLQQPPGHQSNASIVWWPAHTAHPGPGAQYVKRHPAPFAEYIPFRSFFRNFSDKVDLVRKDFVAGRSVGVLPVGQVKLGDIICFEVAYDGLVQDTVRHGANLLTVQTNNATFGYSDESAQQLAMSRLRAIETDRGVVHVSTVGVSALIEPDGSLEAYSGEFIERVLTDRLPLRTTRTLAVRLGTGPEWILTALGLLLALTGLSPVQRAGRRQWLRAVQSRKTPTSTER